MHESIEVLEKVWSAFRFTLFEVSGQKISIFSIATCCLLFYLTVIASRYAEKGVEKFLKERRDLDSGVRDSIKRFTRYTVLIGGAFVALDTIGIKMSSLAAVGAVLMVGIGFGLQNITQNFISGLIILLERPIKIGDFVKVAGISGKVMSIGARSTLINTRDDVTIIVPNSQFISEQVVNETLSSERIRYRIKVGVSYGTDPRLVEETLLEVASEHPFVLKDPDSRVFFEDFGSSSLDFCLTVWMSEHWNYEGVLSEIRFGISEKFKARGIEIPFPQMDIHWRSGDLPQRF